MNHFVSKQLVKKVYTMIGVAITLWCCTAIVAIITLSGVSIPNWVPITCMLAATWFAVYAAFTAVIEYKVEQAEHQADINKVFKVRLYEDQSIKDRSFFILDDEEIVVDIQKNEHGELYAYPNTDMHPFDYEVYKVSGTDTGYPYLEIPYLTLRTYLCMCHDEDFWKNWIKSEENQGNILK